MTQTSSMNVLEGRGKLKPRFTKILMEDGDMMETKKDLDSFTPKFIVEFRQV